MIAVTVKGTPAFNGIGARLTFVVVSESSTAGGTVAAGLAFPGPPAGFCTATAAVGVLLPTPQATSPIPNRSSKDTKKINLVPL